MTCFHPLSLFNLCKYIPFIIGLFSLCVCVFSTGYRTSPWLFQKSHGSRSNTLLMNTSPCMRTLLLLINMITTLMNLVMCQCQLNQRSLCMIEVACFQWQKWTFNNFHACVCEAESPDKAQQSCGLVAIPSKRRGPPMWAARPQAILLEWVGVSLHSIPLRPVAIKLCQSQRACQ